MSLIGLFSLFAGNKTFFENDVFLSSCPPLCRRYSQNSAVLSPTFGKWYYKSSSFVSFFLSITLIISLFTILCAQSKKASFSPLMIRLSLRHICPKSFHIPQKCAKNPYFSRFSECGFGLSLKTLCFKCFSGFSLRSAPLSSACCACQHARKTLIFLTF